MTISFLITQFITNSLVIFVVKIIKNDPFTTSAGLIYQVTTSFITGGLIEIVLSCSNYSYLIKKFNLWRKYNLSFGCLGSDKRS